MGGRRRTWGVGIALGVALALAALVAAGGAGAQGAGTIKLFVIAPVATPIQNYPDAIAGAEAAAAAINKRGGIKGRRLEVGFCNTRSAANQAAACARQAASDRAVAVIGHLSTFTSLELPILQQARIPSIGLFTSGFAIDWTNPISFPLVSGSTGAYLTIPFAAKTLGKKRLVITYQDIPSAPALVKLIRNSARTAGMPVVGTMLMPGATTDFAPLVQQLREMRPDVVLLVNSPGVSGGLMRAATTFGVRPLWAHNTGSIGEAEAAQIGSPADGMLLGSSSPTFRDTRVPGIRRFNAEMRAAGKAGDPVNLKSAGLNSWLAVYAFEAVARKVTGAITNTSVLAALNRQKAPLDIQGIVQFAPGARGPAAYPRWRYQREYFVTVKDGRQVSWGSKLPPVTILKTLKLIR